MDSIAVRNAHVPRITQIDSKYLDNEVLLLLKETLSGAFSNTGQNIYVRIEPELEVALKLFIYHFTIGKLYQSVGQQLLQVRYHKNIPPIKIKCYCLSLVLWPWLKQRISLFSSFFKSENVKATITMLWNMLETTYQGCDLLNLLYFLIEGKYPSLIERVFSMKVSPISDNSIRKISYGYFTRELLWNGFADLLATVLPLIPAKKFHAFICQFLPSVLPVGSFDSKDPKGQQASNKIETICTICNELAILPQTFGCVHVACYYCIHSAIAATSYTCPLCGKRADHSAQITPAIAYKS